MFQDDELVMLSALQHYLFCPRQCALIHMEDIWKDNYLTATGTLLHEHVDSVSQESRKELHIATSLHLVSHQLGLTGIADLVEFHKCNGELDEHGQRVATIIPGLKGLWKPFPVEYKRGKPKTHRADEVQLCGQAICLEEMLHVEIPQGALFYGENRRRTDVLFDNPLRTLTKHVANEVHILLDSGILPEAIPQATCEACSLVDICKPQNFQRKSSVKEWLEAYMDEVTKS